MRRVLEKAWGLLGSFGVACVLLLLLMLLTIVGTLEQQDHSIHVVQEKYFNSLIVIADVFRIAIPLPGGYLLMALLFVNLVAGGIVRIRKGAATVGVIIAHVGILTLIAGGFVEFQFSEKGNMVLPPDEPVAEFESYQDWELVVAEHVEDEPAREWVVPSDVLDDLDPGDTLRVAASELPFALTLSGWIDNARPEHADPRAGVDGVAFREMPRQMQAERDLPGATVTVRTSDGRTERGLVWGGQLLGWPVVDGGRRFTVDLRKESWDLPFALRLDRFVKRDHPQTDRPAEFSSYVTKIEHGSLRDVHVTMNEPLRHRGYVFYQSSWGPQGPDVPPDTPLFSVFAVSKNPADRMPLIALLIVAAGLLVHFVRKLALYVRAQRRRVA